ncbi:unnamed protein product [Brugia timori]|uniref:Uncharacterized protein n=1 Tax=Brugia timori TaxID=42155 RepID=A0A0R3QBC2_9BILA|nr:unnamed protein product [Brugia timori]
MSIVLNEISERKEQGKKSPELFALCLISTCAQLDIYLPSLFIISYHIVLSYCFVL